MKRLLKETRPIQPNEAEQLSIGDSIYVSGKEYKVLQKPKRKASRPLMIWVEPAEGGAGKWLQFGNHKIEI